jgi:hypothetical protein
MQLRKRSLLLNLPKARIARRSQTRKRPVKSQSKTRVLMKMPQEIIQTLMMRKLKKL